MNPNLSKICVRPDDSIKAVLDKLVLHKPAQTKLPGGIVLITEKDGKLVGIATDGDIRRGLAGGAKMEDRISALMNGKPFVVQGPTTSEAILSLASEKIRKEGLHRDRLSKIIIVDKDKKVLDLVSFYDLWRKSDVRFRQIGVHFYENGLERMLKDNLSKNLRIASNFKGANNCDVYFVSVGTPLDGNKKPNLKYLRNASERIGKVLKEGDCVILRSTVPVGATRNFVVPILEKLSGLKAGDGFFVSFAPERTIEGKALEELRNLPQVVGGINRVSADLTATLFGHMTHSTVLVDSLEEAETVKLINNTYRDVTFSFANELSLICHRLGIDTHRVIEAANRGYARSNVPLPGPGVGGACLEKDPFIFIESAKTKDYDPLLVRHARSVSDLMLDFITREIKRFLAGKPNLRNPKVFMMGFAFKGQPVTSDIRGSYSVKLADQLKKNIPNIHVYDPAVRREDILNHGLRYAGDLKTGFTGADVVVVMNNNPAFGEIDIRSALQLTNKPAFLFDTWGIYNREDVAKVKGVEYKRL
ncbi:MAG: UDP-N-acetyl-D-mannosaminuronic acid dehydrogenase [Candidatus Yanofskybacteria bacterium GW2011_GWA2_44_9]|uniref:UDP-N-acetyl-D-mannosaminuronic acid dehydrogenase n=1 Tax=Candidatus Yanofskybacteria bacterium GW2011_GWA2_44_9 TaxID=1619025 RepID=A0A0G1KCX2_9BACT|nr:MAG: UDP-N-acetyl-D-mannosaminuronic acid dehydrogenase [Candidatus Yanofskybacteria bacterium GW2011_GWA2_44_9]